MATSVNDLDLPEIDLLALEQDGATREALIAIVDDVRQQHWLARTPMGVIVTRHDDVTALLRDRRFHSALSMIPRMAGIEEENITGRETPSILSAEGAEHDRLRR